MPAGCPPAGSGPAAMTDPPPVGRPGRSRESLDVRTARRAFTPRYLVSRRGGWPRSSSTMPPWDRSPDPLRAAVAGGLNGAVPA